MKNLLPHFRAAIMSTLMLALVCCGLYPVVVWGITQVVFKDKANGSLLVDKEGTVRGSALLAQYFTGEKYFHPRPSAAGSYGYDAASSSGSNLGPTSQKLSDAIKERITAYRVTEGLGPNDSVPADAVTASGSGLDPHISVRNAELQAPRVAKARQITVEKVRDIIRANTDKPSLGILGDAGVNVLKVNVALDVLQPKP